VKISRTSKGNARITMTEAELRHIQAYIHHKRMTDRSGWIEDASDKFRRLQLPEQLPPCLKPEQYAEAEAEARRRAMTMARIEATPGWPPQ